MSTATQTLTSLAKRATSVALASLSAVWAIAEAAVGAGYSVGTAREAARVAAPVGLRTSALWRWTPRVAVSAGAGPRRKRRSLSPVRPYVAPVCALRAEVAMTVDLADAMGLEVAPEVRAWGLPMCRAEERCMGRVAARVALDGLRARLGPVLAEAGVAI
jgi:hypothetical protein